MPSHSQSTPPTCQRPQSAHTWRTFSKSQLYSHFTSQIEYRALRADFFQKFHRTIWQASRRAPRPKTQRFASCLAQRCRAYSTTEQRYTTRVKRDLCVRKEPLKRDLFTLCHGVERIRQLSNGTPHVSKETYVYEKNPIKETCLHCATV